MSGILTAGERTSVWGTIGDLMRRVARLEAVAAPTGTAPYTVRGALFNDANIIEGSGFTASWDNNGGAPVNMNFYTIYFDTPFDNPPVVSLTPNNNNPPGAAGRYGVSLVTPTTGYVIVMTVDMDDPDSLAAQDGGFDFICMETA